MHPQARAVDGFRKQLRRQLGYHRYWLGNTGTSALIPLATNNSTLEHCLDFYWIMVTAISALC